MILLRLRCNLIYFCILNVENELRIEFQSVLIFCTKLYLFVNFFVNLFWKHVRITINNIINLKNYNYLVI